MNTENCCVSARRLHVAAYLKFGGVDKLLKQTPVTARAVWAQLQRKRLTEPVRTALESALGPDAWAFVTGTVDTLRDAAPAVEDRP